ncbi:hypothetical protein RO3G_00813 [Lichtheimia corymbifera JMRC:FSU:9682]|uniref:Uncharacterized protein n=1 Tax=Lichtheimia corymbifera JMRC:FSU:9682 TaxID=1263082 RepID=A0A068SFZ5_9FUNG|nr:hypothetical protein RO3G_00813 [Lichtheimia corymbifera JMRC:FSU:9682]
MGATRRWGNFVNHVACLKSSSELERLVLKHNPQGVIYTRHLLPFLDSIEQTHGHALLISPQKAAIEPYCKANPNVEMTTSDIVALLTLVPPQLHNSDQDSNPMMQSNEQELLEKEARRYRRSIQLTRSIRRSEHNLTSLTRENEDRIVQLQSRVDDMNSEVARQKHEIQEYKKKESTSLQQIDALEAHIASIESTETNQKMMYRSMKKLYNEKCQEARELHDMLHQKARVLEETERLCQSINNEFHHLKHEKSKLLAMQSTLERELATSRYTHVQLEEQRNENQRLKEIIGGLQSNLLQADQDLDQQRLLYDDGLDYIMNDNAGGAMEDISQVRQELTQLKYALNQENMSLAAELLRFDAFDNPTEACQDVCDGHKMPTAISLAQQEMFNNKDTTALTNTATTFALYTLLVYIFGIVTSTFLLENAAGSSTGLEALMTMASSSQAGPGSSFVTNKLLEVIIYWIEKIVFENRVMAN